MDASEHRRLGVELNNATWKVLADGGPSPDADADALDDLLYGAYASAYHWRHAEGATVANRVRGEHLVSRAATAVGRFIAGLDHGMRCLELCVQHPDEVEDWDVAFAYEAIARSLAGLGKRRDARRQKRIAADRGAAIADPEDRKVFLEEFERGPWFGI
ncbi:MAG TPA: hypothetical protein VFY15_00380 [Acidimicrobiia bacterium]|nr:hypothetical protein [Acidimicrobiia bacterium]